MELAHIRTLADIERVELESPLESRGYPRTVPELLHHSRERFGECPCIVEVPDALAPSRHRSVPYYNFVDDTRRLARALGSLGLGRHDVVSLLTGASIAAETALWGSATACIVNPLNPYLAPSQLAALMREARTRVLVVEPRIPGLDIWEKVRDVLVQVPGLERVWLIGGVPAGGAPGATGGLRLKGFEDVLAEHAPLPLPPQRLPQPDDVSTLFHTGGTTGLPKLARHTHWNQASSCCLFAETMGWGPADRLLVGLPLFHVNAALLTGLAGLAAGSTVVLAGGAGFRAPTVVPQLWALVQHFGISFVSAVPTVYTRWIEQPRPAGKTSLRFGLCGGAPLSRAMLMRIESELGLKILEGYGLTEGTMLSALNPPHGERRAGSVGLRRPYQQLRIVTLDVDGQIAADCAPGTVGEIVMGGHHVIPGYVREAATQRAFTRDGWLKTGDLARQDADGYLWLAGRSKDLIIRGGHNIEPGVIEEAMLGHPSVQTVAAVGRLDADVGELPYAFVVPRPGAEVSPEALLEFARERVPERAAVPVGITLLGELPVTSVGKVDKLALRRLAAAPVVRACLEGVGVETRFELVPSADAAMRVDLPADTNDAELARASQALQALPVELARRRAEPSD